MRWRRNPQGGVRRYSVAHPDGSDLCVSVPDGPVPNDLPARLRGLMLRDERRLSRRLDGLRAVRDKAARAAAHAKIDDDIAKAEARVVRRTTGVPAISYPPALPVSQAKDELLAAIRDHQVVIVAGETGSGKTTQLPKICLELGRGVRGLIGHTQPRRLAARTVAERIAEELDTRSARRWAGRCASPTRSATTPSSR